MSSGTPPSRNLLLQGRVFDGGELRKRYEPQRRLVLLDVKMRMKLDYLSSLFSCISDADVMALSSVITAHPMEEYAHAALILDFSKAKVEPEELAARIRRMCEVVAISYAEVPLTVGTASMVAYTLDDMAAFLKALYAKVGVAAKVLLFHVGIDVGARKADEIMKVSGGRDAVERMLLWISGLGWGVPRLTRYAEGREAVIAVERLFECMCVEGEGSHYFRGFLKGFFDRLWGVETQVVETMCSSSGAGECKFLVTAVKR